MKFLQVVFLAMFQLTAIPFIAMLSAHTLAPSAAPVEVVTQNQQVANTITTVYKTVN